jgi:peptidase inhibitor family I36
MKTLRRMVAATFAVFALSSLVVATPAQAQGSCPSGYYCIWVDVNFVWPYCWWPGDDGTYYNDWCSSNGGNEHLAANAATSYHNNGVPDPFDAIRSFREEWYGGSTLTWYAPRGARVGWVGAGSNDDAESHYWYNG